MTFDEAFASLNTLQAWFRDNCRPRVPVTDIYIGDYAINNQADADALVGKTVKGRVRIYASGTATTKLDVRDFGVQWDGVSTGIANTMLVELMNGADNVHIHHFLLDGRNGLTTSGIFGTLYSEGVLAELGEIRRMGNDGFRTHKNSVYRRLYVRSFRAWSDADGPYDTNASQDLCPHSDGSQTLRSGNLIEECWIDNTPAANGTSAVIIMSGTNETIDGATVRRCYLNGGGYTVHIHNANVSLTNPGPYGYPQNIVLADNIFGRNYRLGLWSHGDVPSDNITKSGNVWADTRLPVPDAYYVAHP